VEEVVTSAHSTKTLSDTEKETIIDALERNGGRRNVTAKELNISERTLYRKIKEYGIE
jgi:transcriptional regulator with PAS, ATPase and Fis domain